MQVEESESLQKNDYYSTQDCREDGKIQERKIKARNVGVEGFDVGVVVCGGEEERRSRVAASSTQSTLRLIFAYYLFFRGSYICLFREATVR